MYIYILTNDKMSSQLANLTDSYLTPVLLRFNMTTETPAFHQDSLILYLCF